MESKEDLRLKPLLTVKDVAEILSRTVPSIYKMNSLGHLPTPKKIGKYLYWPNEHFWAWIDSIPPEDELSPPPPPRR